MTWKLWALTIFGVAALIFMVVDTWWALRKEDKSMNCPKCGGETIVMPGASAFWGREVRLCQKDKLQIPSSEELYKLTHKRGIIRSI